MTQRAGATKRWEAVAEHPARERGPASRREIGRRLAILGCMALAFLAVAGQLVRLAVEAQFTPRLAVSEPPAKLVSRPNIVDRHGRLLASDVVANSLYAEPSHLLDADEVVEKLRPILGDLGPLVTREALRDRQRGFLWIKRGLSPQNAQAIHDLGLPGLRFREEPRRVYPAGRLAGHVLGHVNIDNRGQAGIERHIDAIGGTLAVHRPMPSSAPPVRLTIDMPVQHALEQELQGAIARYGAEGAAGVLLDVSNGDVLAAASLPSLDPAQPPGEDADPAFIDRLGQGSYELGSIFKLITVGMVLDLGLAELTTIYDVRQPLQAGRFTIDDPFPAGRPLTLADVFVRSSNVGAGMMALQAGADLQRRFLDRLGLTQQFATEAGPMRAPRLPQHWGRAETITVAYGHGLALSPLQFAAVAAGLVNGGLAVQPRFLVTTVPPEAPARLVASETSAKLRWLLRQNVTERAGSGRRADVPGFEVGGKTGTADRIEGRRYAKDSVNASFLAAFPMSQPRYVLLVTLNDPQPVPETDGKRTAGTNAAPTAGRIIARAAPLLGLVPSVRGIEPRE